MAKKTPLVADNIFGEKLYQQRARIALPILVRQAKAMQKIYYEDIARELGIPNPRNMNYPLGSIGVTLEELSEKWDAEIPKIQCLVVNKRDELPGEGISWFISDKDNCGNLTKQEKQELLNINLACIYFYPHWDEVLHVLDLEELESNFSDEISKASHSGGGEGRLHKAMKRYIASHPALLDSAYAGLKAKIECSLPSGDSLDVSLLGRKKWIGIEVKPRTSGSDDITRGLFQCVKYQAVMNAQAKVERLKLDINVHLVLESGLPKELVPLKNILGVSVIDNFEYE